jgi:hypothetical protein
MIKNEEDSKGFGRVFNFQVRRKNAELLILEREGLYLQNETHNLKTKQEKLARFVKESKNYCEFLAKNLLSPFESPGLFTFSNHSLIFIPTTLDHLFDYFYCTVHKEFFIYDSHNFQRVPVPSNEKIYNYIALYEDRLGSKHIKKE